MLLTENYEKENESTEVVEEATGIAEEVAEKADEAAEAVEAVEAAPEAAAEAVVTAAETPETAAEDKAPAAEEKTPAKKKKWWLLIILIVCVLAAGAAAYFIFFSGSVESKAKRMMSSGDYAGAKEILVAADPADYSRKTLVDCNIGLIKSAIEEKGTHSSNGKRIYTMSDGATSFFELTKDDELILGWEYGLSGGESAYIGAKIFLNMYIDGSAKVFFESEVTIEMSIYGRTAVSNDTANGTVDLSKSSSKVNVENYQNKTDSSYSGMSTTGTKEDFQKSTDERASKAIANIKTVLKQVGLEDITIKDLFVED